jgi:hypothetical protein
VIKARPFQEGDQSAPDRWIGRGSPHADIFLENGVFIETGPHKHAIQQTFFLYVYEPGGNRVEVANAGARLILAPDWQPIVRSEAERAKGQAWGLKTIESFHTHERHLSNVSEVFERPPGIDLLNRTISGFQQHRLSREIPAPLVVSRIFRTFDQAAAAPVCASCW